MFFESLIYSAENFHDASAHDAQPDEKSHTNFALGHNACEACEMVCPSPVCPGSGGLLSSARASGPGLLPPNALRGLNVLAYQEDLRPQTNKHANYLYAYFQAADGL